MVTHGLSVLDTVMSDVLCCRPTTFHCRCLGQAPFSVFLGWAGGLIGVSLSLWGVLMYPLNQAQGQLAPHSLVTLMQLSTSIAGTPVISIYSLRLLR